MRGIFITFEGVDGCGKSTQMRFLDEYLRGRGYDTLVTREPGGCQISEQIRGVLLDVNNTGMCDRTEALLYAAARAQHTEQVIKPSLAADKIVLCDRFTDSSLAYQGIGRGLGAGNILAINNFATGGLVPDKTFFLDFPPDLAFKRMNEKKKHDRLELQKEDFYKRLYDGFLELAQAQPDRIIIIDARGEKSKTRERIRANMDEILAVYRHDGGEK